MTLVVILETAPSSTLRDIEGIKCILAPFIVIDGGNGGLALGDVAVAVGISGMSGHNLVLGKTFLPDLELRAGRSNGVGYDPLGVPSPANTRFTGNQYGLILDVPDRATVGTLINGGYTFRYTPRIWNHVQSPAETPITKPQVPSPLE